MFGFNFVVTLLYFQTRNIFQLLTNVSLLTEL